MRERVEAIRASLTKRAGSVEQVTSHIVRQIIERGCKSIKRGLKR